MTGLNSNQVVSILGRIEDAKMAEIIGLGASWEELLEAKRWSDGYQRTISDQENLRPNVISHLCEILSTDESDWQDR